MPGIASPAPLWRECAILYLSPVRVSTGLVSMGMLKKREWKFGQLSYDLKSHSQGIFSFPAQSLCGVGWLASELPLRQGTVFHYCVSTASGCPGHCHKLPQTWWLKTTEIYSRTVLEARMLKLISWASIEVWTGLGSPRRFPARSHSMPPLPVSAGCRRPLACGHVTPVSALRSHCLLCESLCRVSLHLLHLRICAIASGGHGRVWNDLPVSRDSVF